jgi:hypothetical protein
VVSGLLVEAKGWRNEAGGRGRVDATAMGGPICIHGYLGEYPKKLSKFSNYMIQLSIFVFMV